MELGISKTQAALVFEQAVEKNLHYWKRAIKGQSLGDSIDGLAQAIHYGQSLPSTFVSTNDLLRRAYLHLNGTRAKQFLPYYERGLLASSDRFRAELLFMTGALALESGDIKKAHSLFNRSNKKANNPILEFRNAIGLCLCHWSASPRSQITKQLEKLQSMLNKGSMSSSLQASGMAVLGLSAFWQGAYERALRFLEFAAEETKRGVKTQLLLHAGLCHQALFNRKAALKEYNRAAALLQTIGQEKQLARLEIVRAALHYQDAATGQTWRLKPAHAALSRAAGALNSDEPHARALLEDFMGRVYARSGKIEKGLAYLNSALDLAKTSGATSLVEDSFGVLAALNKKAPQGF